MPIWTVRTLVVAAALKKQVVVERTADGRDNRYLKLRRGHSRYRIAFRTIALKGLGRCERRRDSDSAALLRDVSAGFNMSG